MENLYLETTVYSKKDLKKILKICYDNQYNDCKIISKIPIDKDFIECFKTHRTSFFDIHVICHCEKLEFEANDVINLCFHKFILEQNELVKYSFDDFTKNTFLQFKIKDCEIMYLKVLGEMLNNYVIDDVIHIMFDYL